MIVGCALLWPNGKETTFSIKEEKIYLTLDDTQLCGTLDLDEDRITWVDGDVWTRTSKVKRILSFFVVVERPWRAGFPINTKYLISNRQN